MNNSSASIPPNDEVTPEQWARRDRFVRFLVYSTAVLFCAMVGLLFFRWLVASEPSSVAQVNVGQKLAGAIVIVDGVSLSQPYRVTIDAVHGSARFFLGPGRYTLEVLYGDDEQVLYEAEFTMPANRAVQFELVDRLFPATRPSK